MEWVVAVKPPLLCPQCPPTPSCCLFPSGSSYTGLSGTHPLRGREITPTVQIAATPAPIITHGQGNVPISAEGRLVLPPGGWQLMGAK